VGFTELKGAGESDVWVLKFDAKGSLQWERTFGDEGHDYLGGFTATADGGYAVANIRESNDGSAAWLLKLDASGELQWERKLKVDWADAMITTADGGYALAGTTLDGSWVTLTLMLKLDASGELQWERKFGGGSESSHSSLAATADGGYVVAHTQTDLEAFDSESAILKLDVAGGLQWKRTFKGNGINTIIASADGGYAVAGWTHLEGTRGIQGWVLKLDQNGQISDSLAKQ
jgi:hypothetical protein